jgi:predicted secreted protein
MGGIVHINRTNRRSPPDRQPGSGTPDPAMPRKSTVRRKVILTTLGFGILSGACHAAVILITEIPGLNLSDMVWTSF